MAQEILSTQCEQYCNNVSLIKRWVRACGAVERVTEQSGVGSVALEGSANCPGPKRPGAKGEWGTGICQVAFEKPIVLNADEELVADVPIPEEPPLNRDLNLRLGGM